MRILIAGGAGFIGSNLAQYHINRNDEVWIIDNLITGKKDNIARFLSNKKFCFFEKDIVSFTFDNFPFFDIIYHLASPASPPKFKEYALEISMANSLGTKNLLDFALRTKSKTFVFASSSEVYGDPQIHPQPENYWGNVNSHGPRSCYDEGKRFAESLIMSYWRKYQLDIRIARIFNTYGPNMEKDDGRVVSNFIYQGLNNQPLTVYGNGKQTRSLTYISDLIRGLYLLSTTKKLAGQIINLGNPDERRIIEVAQLVKKLVQGKNKIIYKSLPEDDPKKRKPDITKAKNLLGWKPKISLEAGLIKTIEFFKTYYL